MGKEPKTTTENLEETKVVNQDGQTLEEVRETPKETVSKSNAKSADIVSKAMQDEAKKDHVPGVATVHLLNGTEATPEEVVTFSKLREHLGVTPGKLKKIILDEKLVKEYNLSKDDVKLITNVLTGIEKEKISHLDVTHVTPEIRVIMQKHGVTLGSLKNPEELKKLVKDSKELKALSEFYEGIIYK